MTQQSKECKDHGSRYNHQLDLRTQMTLEYLKKNFHWGKSKRVELTLGDAIRRRSSRNDIEEELALEIKVLEGAIEQNEVLRKYVSCPQLSTALGFQITQQQHKLNLMQQLFSDLQCEDFEELNQHRLNTFDSQLRQIDIVESEIRGKGGR